MFRATRFNDFEPAEPNQETSMTTMPPTVAGLPHVIHRSETELPFVNFMDGLAVQLLQVDIEAGLWVVRARFAPGLTLPRHKHTGEVFALTFSGSWKYLEYPEINTAGSYLFEPSGSIHTLHAPATNTEATEAWFAIRGANLNLNEAGEVESVWDAGFILDTYLALCKEAGHPAPNVIGI
ncbi:MAG TPA: cupin [Oxalobacteraceae bacterium]|nr:cupin [Oxalobacteraceae bacterium]